MFILTLIHADCTFYFIVKQTRMEQSITILFTAISFIFEFEKLNELKKNILEPFNMTR